MIKKHIFRLTGQRTACSAVQVLYFFEHQPPSTCQSVTPIKVTRVTVTLRSDLLFQSVRLRFVSTQIIRFSSGSLFEILKIRFSYSVQLRLDKNSVKPVYKTPVRFDSLVFAFGKTSIINTLNSFEKSCCIPKAFRDALVEYEYCVLCKLSKISKLSSVIFFSLLTKKIYISAKNVKLNYFLPFCSKNCSGSVTLC